MDKEIFERQIFKVGDRVFDALYGWGEVFSYKERHIFPMFVVFDDGKKAFYTWDGSFNKDCNPSLSFTEYKLEGFSQERQIKFPCTGAFGFRLDKFGICIRQESSGRYIEESGGWWDFFAPMTFEKYCELKGLKL